MSEFFSTMGLSASGMAAQSARLRVVSENIANADTPGYRRKTLSFEAVAAGLGAPGAASPAGAVRAGPLHLAQGDLPRIHDPGHPLAGPDGYYDGSSVNLMIEIADAREAQRSYEANLNLFNQTREMISSTLALLRR